MTDREALRALVEAGYAPHRHYVEDNEVPPTADPWPPMPEKPARRPYLFIVSEAGKLAAILATFFVAWSVL